MKLELTDEKMDKVSGGDGLDRSYSVDHSDKVMTCPYCGKDTIWKYGTPMPISCSCGFASADPAQWGVGVGDLYAENKIDYRIL